MINIPISSNKYTSVDDEDADFINQWHWSFNGKYVVRGQRYGERKYNKQHKIYLHRIVSNAPNDKIVDHIDKNTLNNQKNNLRICSQVENQQNRKKSKNNTSGYNGIYWHKIGKKWMAYITYQGKRIHCGLHDNIEQALKARKDTELKLWNKITNN
jgi:hypothetical protein